MHGGSKQEHKTPSQHYLITFSPEGDLMPILHPLVYMYLPRNREWERESEGGRVGGLWG